MAIRSPLRVSQTRVGTWRDCHAKYYYRYVMKLRRKRKERPLVFGSIVHQMVEADANGENPFELLNEIEKSQGKMFRSMADEYGNLIDDVHDIMTDYWKYWGDGVEYIGIKKKYSEFTFEVEIDKATKQRRAIVLIGKIDNFAKTPNKLRWLVEHKTGKNIPNEDHRWKSIQAALYIRVAETVGIKVDGTLWDFIRSKPPTKPKLKKDGELSLRELDTLPSRIDRMFDEENLDKKQPTYKTLMDRAEENRPNYFQRVFTPTKKKVVDRLFDDFMISAREIADHDEDVPRDMNIGRHCEWCSFEPICRATLRAYDVDFVIKADYVVSEGHEDEEPDLEA